MGQATPSATSQASCVIVSGFRAALDLDTYPLIGALNGLNLVEVSQCSLCIWPFRLFFTPYLSNADVMACMHDGAIEQAYIYIIHV